MELGFSEERGELKAIELEQGQDDVGKDRYKDDLKPWEQHSAVISIPRYDYKAASSLMERPHSGFLITCPIKREKSATKEAICILEEHMGFVCNNDIEGSEQCSKNVYAKRRKTCLQDGGNLNILGETAEVSFLLPVDNGNGVKNLKLSLVKMTGSGLLFFTLPYLDYHVINTVSSIFSSLDSGNLKKPIWCHRIFPIQETCCLTEANLQAVVTNLVERHFNSQQEKLGRPIKFAVGYNKRGTVETDLKNPKCASGIALLERNKCFSVVAGAFKNVVENSLVDLNSPEVVVFVELLPLSGIPPDSLMAGVSLIPCKFVMTKPRLCIKPLLINTTATTRRRNK